LNIQTLHEHFLKSTGICTDTREIEKGSIFVALKGENFNGNKFTQEALDKGAYKVIIDEITYHKNTGETILCKSALSYLQQLATFHRNSLKIPIIALTGSNGKTTTKELIHAVLSKKYNTTATKGNLNNHIGVPLTLLRMNKETEIGIVEMGANHLKEIAKLCEIAQPDYGYITNFGKAHLEGFGSLDGVVKGKSELYKHLIQNGKYLFMNADDPKQKQILDPYNKKFGFSESNQEFSNIKLKACDPYVKASFNNVTIASKLIGKYNFTNICAAIIIGQYFEVTSEDIKKGIEEYTPRNNRSQVIEKDSNKIILDAYNANPTSMLAALESFKTTSDKNKIVFLGDMFELGDSAALEHQIIADYITKYSIGNAFLIGENFSKTKVQNKSITKVESFDKLKKILEDKKITSSTILIKASRGMALERIVGLL
jgi:UDP-N-acetylmuramoyl-tripeptide--D-alanyl-D-alanine ligase